MLSQQDKQKLKSYGFLNVEINQIDKAKVNQYSKETQVVDIRSPEFRRLIASRKRRVTELRKQGMDNLRIAQYIYNYYRGKKDNKVWDFLQFDYYKKPQKTTRADYDRKKRRIHQKLGKSYGGSKPYG